jgi:hypothetical protein
MTGHNKIHWVWMKKSWSHFRSEFSTSIMHRWKLYACGKRVPVANGRAFIPSPNELRVADRTRSTAAPLVRRQRPHGTAQPPARRAAVGYSSPVCSSQGEAIDRVAAAIDQLATDARGRADHQELTARVADVWEMISDLDPELARRAQAYNANEGDAPSE